VLIVSYYFPPAAGGGVQRVLKWAKYLPQSGIEVHVLTPDADDLGVMGANMMDVERRADVLLTAREGMVRRLGLPAAQKPASVGHLAGRRIESRAGGQSSLTSAA